MLMLHRYLGASSSLTWGGVAHEGIRRAGPHVDVIPVVPEGVEDGVDIDGPKGLQEEVKHALHVMLRVGDPLPRVIGRHQEPGEAVPSIRTDLGVPAVLRSLRPNDPPALHIQE